MDIASGARICSRPNGGRPLEGLVVGDRRDRRGRLTTVGARVVFGLGAGIWLAAALMLLAAPGVSADAQALCNAGDPNWAVIVEASSNGPAQQFLCNYRV